MHYSVISLVTTVVTTIYSCNAVIMVLSWCYHGRYHDLENGSCNNDDNDENDSCNNDDNDDCNDD